MLLFTENIQLALDSHFGKLTQQAVMDYQRKMGLVASGVVEADTWEFVVRSRLSGLPCIALLPNLYDR
ncbi:MAG: peptidoglycan-binding protein [Phormidesmis sp. RL_2_1]|nr:peptidoglycan-binding protein [Phormidesmis sp. RL_2_1]